MTATTFLLHLLATTVLISQLVSTATAAADDDSRDSSRGEARSMVFERSRWLGWASLVALIVTGLLMLGKWHVGLQALITSAFYENRFGRLLLIKLVGTAVLAVGLLSRRSATKRLARASLLLGLFLILVSVHIVR